MLFKTHQSSIINNPVDICINDEGHVVVADFLAIESRS